VLGEPRAARRDRAGHDRRVGDAVRVTGRGLDPRRHRGRVERGEREREVGEVALDVDHEHGHLRAQRLLDEHGHEAGLAAPRHADDDAVREEVIDAGPSDGG
jgi:hypothetical protein